MPPTNRNVLEEGTSDEEGTNDDSTAHSFFWKEITLSTPWVDTE